MLVWITSPALAGSEQPQASIVAEVNGSVITQVDFGVEMRNIQGRLYREGRPLDHSRLLEIQSQVIEKLINRELLYQESQKTGFRVNEAVIDAEFEAWKKRFPGEDDYKIMLRTSNLSEDFLRSRFRKWVVVNHFVEHKFGQTVRVSAKDIKTYYAANPGYFKQAEQMRASHILITVDLKADRTQRSKARKRIEDIERRVQKGEDFSALAREFSECPSSERGGDLGYFGRGQLVKPFEDAAYALNQGEVSPVVETSYGYHVIKVFDRKPKRIISYEDAKESIARCLRNQEVNRQVGVHLEKLKETAQIKRCFAEYSCPVTKSGDSCTTCH